MRTDLWCGVVSGVLELRRNRDLLETYSDLNPGWNGDCLPIDCCYNSDQTPVTFETVESRGWTRAGVKNVFFATGGQEKERITFQLTTSLGGEKIKPLAVLKGERIESNEDGT